jgi:hypothetical protein
LAIAQVHPAQVNLTPLSGVNDLGGVLHGIGV